MRKLSIILFCNYLMLLSTVSLAMPQGLNLVRQSSSTQPLVHAPRGKKMASIIYRSQSLILQKLSDRVFVHVSYLPTQTWGKVACNGMVVVDGHEAVVFDTPANSKGTSELIRYLTTERKLTIKAVVPTHFHEDCLAGIDEFHQKRIPSYGGRRTLQALQEAGITSTLPQRRFNDSLQLKVGKQRVRVRFIGEGHTRDNVVAYFPEEEVLFGGCLIKEQGAEKGFLGDANVPAWPETVQKIRAAYPKLKTVIPGHGKVGGPELIDYTIRLFQ